MPENTASSNSFMQNTDTYQVLNSSTKYDNVFLGFILYCKIQQKKPPNKQAKKIPCLPARYFWDSF